ncbi:MAG: hypothetical protein K2W95_35315 [Candidatus Obscuribacterales bacterium]|nr:hypothetical protein [Candidatus Obscuribacterales bacterium]
MATRLSSNKLAQGFEYLPQQLCAFFQLSVSPDGKEYFWPNIRNMDSLWLLLDSGQCKFSPPQLEIRGLTDEQTLPNIQLAKAANKEVLVFSRSGIQTGGLNYHGSFSLIESEPDCTGSSLRFTAFEERGIASLPTSDTVNTGALEKSLVRPRTMSEVYLWRAIVHRTIDSPTEFLSIADLFTDVICSLGLAHSNHGVTFPWDQQLLSVFERISPSPGSDVATIRQEVSIQLRNSLPTEAYSSFQGTLNNFFCGLAGIDEHLDDLVLEKITRMGFDKFRFPFAFEKGGTFIQLHPNWRVYLCKHRDRLIRAFDDAIILNCRLCNDAKPLTKRMLLEIYIEPEHESESSETDVDESVKPADSQTGVSHDVEEEDPSVNTQVTNELPDAKDAVYTASTGTSSENSADCFTKNEPEIDNQTSTITGLLERPAAEHHVEEQRCEDKCEVTPAQVMDADRVPAETDIQETPTSSNQATEPAPSLISCLYAPNNAELTTLCLSETLPTIESIDVVGLVSSLWRTQQLSSTLILLALSDVLSSLKKQDFLVPFSLLARNYFVRIETLHRVTGLPSDNNNKTAIAALELTPIPKGRDNSEIIRQRQLSVHRKLSDLHLNLAFIAIEYLEHDLQSFGDPSAPPLFRAKSYPLSLQFNTSWGRYLKENVEQVRAISALALHKQVSDMTTRDIATAPGQIFPLDLDLQFSTERFLSPTGPFANIFFQSEQGNENELQEVSNAEQQQAGQHPLETEARDESSSEQTHNEGEAVLREPEFYDVADGTFAPTETNATNLVVEQPGTKDEPLQSIGLASDAESLVPNYITRLEKLDGLFADRQNSYKFLLFEALLEQCTNDEPEQTISLDDLVVEMLILAARIVSLNGEISFGLKDQMLTYLDHLGVKPQRFPSRWDDYRKEKIRTQAAATGASIAADLKRYVPYRLLRPFFEDCLKGVDGKEFNTRVVSYSQDETMFVERQPLYRFTADGASVVLNPTWFQFFSEYKVEVTKWLDEQFLEYLKSKNSGKTQIVIRETPDTSDDDGACDVANETEDAMDTAMMLQTEVAPASIAAENPIVFESNEAEISEEQFAMVLRTFSHSREFLCMLALLHRSLEPAGTTSSKLVSLDELAVRMLVLAWRPVRISRIALDSDEQVSQLLQGLDAPDFPIGANLEQRFKEFMKHVSLFTDKSRTSLAMMSIRSLLSPFFRTETGSQTADDLPQLSEFSRTFFEVKKPFFSVHETSNWIELHPEWQAFFKNSGPELLPQLIDAWCAHLGTLNKVTVDPRTLFDGPELNQYKPQREITPTVTDTGIRQPGIEQSMPAPSTANLKVVYASALSSGEEECRIFSGLAPDDGQNSVIQAFHRIAERLTVLPEPKSLCEITPSTGDFRWLVQWASSLTPTCADSFLGISGLNRLPGNGNYTRREGIGTLLLLLAAEVNRREGQEGSVWAKVLRLFKKDVGRLIRFQSGPSLQFAQSIEEATEVLRLRNVFGTGDTLQYLMTVFLQFGFTRNGISRLPHWLAGQYPETVNCLISKHSPNFSATFCDIWELLRRFLRKTISESQTRSELKKSVWIHDEWIDDIIASLASRSRAQSDSSDSLGVDDANDSEIIKSTSFQWDSSGPGFQFSIGSLQNLNLDAGDAEDESLPSSASAPTLLVAGKRYRLAKSDNRWQPLEDVKSALVRSPILVQVVTADGAIAASQEIHLWPPDSEVQFYDLETGQEMDLNSRLSTQRRYAVIASDDLLPSIDLGDPVPYGQIRKNVWRLKQSWDKTLEFRLPDQQVLWSNQDSISPQPAPLQVMKVSVFARNVDNLAKGVVFYTSNESTAVRVEALRIDGVSIPIYWNGKCSESAPMELTSLFSEKVRGVWKIRHNGRLYSRKNNINIAPRSGSARWTGFAWNPIDNESTLRKSDCTDNSFRLCYRSMVGDSAEDYAIFEGGTLCQWFTHSDGPIRGVSGYGAPLEVRRMYNSDGVCASISKSVSNPGLFEQCSWETESSMKLTLTKPVQLDQNHKLIVWPSNSHPIGLESRDLIKNDDLSYEFVPGMTNSNIVAVCLSYSGEWLGASWPTGRGMMQRFLEENIRKSEAGSIAAFLRWTHWPILATEHFRDVRAFAYNFPAEVLAAWAGDLYLDEPYKFEPGTTGWYNVVRQVFSKFQPNWQTVEKLSSLLRQSPTELDRISTLATTLQKVDATLLAKFFSCWLNSPSRSSTPTEIRQLVERLQRKALGLTDDAPIEQITEKEKELKSSYRRFFRVDEQWLANEMKSIASCSFAGHPLSDIQLAHMDTFWSQLRGRELLTKFVYDEIKRCL